MFCYLGSRVPPDSEVHVLLSPLFVRVVFNGPERTAEIFLAIDDGRRTGSTRVAFVSFSVRGFGWSGGCRDEDGLAKIKEYLRLKVFIPPWRDHAHIPRREGQRAPMRTRPHSIFDKLNTQAPHPSLCMYILRVSFFPSISNLHLYH